MSIFERFSTYPSDLVGLLAFSAATIACLIAARRSGLRDARTWNVLALINCLFVIEIYFGSRYRITELAITRLKTEDLYPQLHGWFQETIIIAIAAMAIIFITLFLFWRLVAGAAARVAASITIAVLALFVIETVSLHAIDAIFYRPIGPLLMLGWVWAIAAAGICLAAFSVRMRKIRG
jgi:hypothetical protein